MYLEQSEFLSARNMFDSVIYYSPSNAFAFNNRGLASKGLGDIGDACADFKRAIAIDPTFQDAWNNLGVLHFEAGDFEASLECLNKAIALSDHSDYLINRGILRLHQGHSKDAREDLENALRKDSNNDTIVGLIHEANKQGAKSK